MITPFLEASRAGASADYLHDDLRPGARGDPRRRGLPRAGDRDHRRDHRGHPRRGRRGAPRARRRRGAGRDRGVVLPAGAGPRLLRSTVVERIWEVLEAFASFGFCKAHAAAFALPTYQSAWLKAHHPAALPRRGAHPRPGHVPQAADPRRRPPVRHRGARPRRQRLRATSTASSGSTPDATTPPPGHPRRGREPRPDAGRGCRRPRLRHPARAGRGQGHQRGRGRADRRRPALRRARRLLAPRPGLPAGRRAAGARRGVRLPSTASGRPARGPAAAAGSPGATCCSRSPSSTGGSAGAGRRRAAAGGSSSRASRRRARPAGERVDVRERAAAQSQAAREVVPAAEQPTQLTLDLGDRPRLGAGRRAARDDRRRSGCAPSSRSSASTSAGTSSTSTPRSSTRSGSPAAATCSRRRSRSRGAGRRGQGRHPDPADPVRAPGRLPHPRRRHRPGRLHLLRGRPGPLRRDRLPLLAAGGARGAAPHRRRAGSRCGPPAPGSSPALHDAWQLGGLERRARRDRRGRGGCRGPRRGGRGRRPRAATPAPAAGCSSTPPGSSCRPTPTSSRPGTTRARAGGPRGTWCPRPRPRRCPRASCGTPAPAAPDTRVVTTHPTHRAPHPRRSPAVSDERGRHRRAGAQPGLRTAAVQAALDTLAAEPQRRARPPAAGARHRRRHRRLRRPARRGRPPRHRRRPQPRRPRRPGAAGPARPASPTASPPCRATPTPSASRSPAASAGTTWSACHGVLEVVDDPAAALATIAAVLRPGGTLSPARRPAARRRPRPGPGRPVRPRPGDPRAPRRPLGRRRPRAAPVRRARGARPARRRRPHHRCEATASASSATSSRSALLDSEADRGRPARARGRREPPPRPPAARDLGSVRHVLATRD